MGKDVDGVVAFLKQRGVDSPFMDQVVDEVYGELVLDMPDSGSGSIGVVNGEAIMVRGLRWVVHDRDVDLIKNLLAGVGSLTTTGLVLPPGTSSSVIQGVVGVVSSLFLICRNLLKRGAKLEPVQFHVLGVLRTRQGSTAKELAESLAASGSSWTEIQVKNELEKLSKVRLGDGTVTALVMYDADERWSVVDL